MSTNLNTMIAHTTMRTSWGSIEATGCTPFHSYLNSLYFCSFVQWSTEVLIPILISFSYKQNELCTYLQEHVFLFINNHQETNPRGNY